MCTKKRCTRAGRIAVYLLYKDAVAVVYLMLDDLGSPAGEILYMGLHRTVLPLDLDSPVAPRPALSLQRKTALLGEVRTLAVDDDRIEHLARRALVVKNNDGFVHADHIGSHADTAVFVAVSVSSRSSATDRSLASAGSAFCARKTTSVIRGRTIEITSCGIE